jgi:hypothetical protein
VDMSPGRELAIEMLIDMEPEGAFYRAARVLVRRFVWTLYDEDFMCITYRVL